MPHKRHPKRQLVNFSAGPSAQPLDVLFKAQRDLIDYESTETSVLELSHRSAAFSKIMHNTESLARELL
jgi:phosphoserine aminotransferase